MALTRWLRQAPRLAARDELDRLRLERLRGALIAGESSGLGEDVSTDELMAELDEETRAEAKRKKAWSEIRRIIDEVEMAPAPELRPRPNDWPHDPALRCLPAAV